MAPLTGKLVHNLEDNAVDILSQHVEQGAVSHLALKRKSQNHRGDVDLLVHYVQRQDTSGVMFLDAGVDLREGSQDSKLRVVISLPAARVSLCLNAST